MIRRLAQVRLRLIDAVALAAIAVLALKIVGLLAAPPVRAPSGSNGPGEQISGFFRAVANARTNYVPPDVTMTGAVPDKKAEDTKPEATVTSEDSRTKRPAIEFLGQPTSPAERALLERLGERREEIQQKGHELELRERLLENAERRIEARLNELKGAEDKASEAQGKRGDTEAAAIRNLVTMYEAMKPKEAARVFDRLPIDVLVPVVMQMNPRKMAEVLAVMSPEAAEKLTVALATRARAAALPGPSPAAALPATELPAIGKAAAIEHDPEKVGTGFRKRSCSNKQIERDDDSKKNHPALVLAAGLDPARRDFVLGRQTAVGGKLIDGVRQLVGEVGKHLVPRHPGLLLKILDGVRAERLFELVRRDPVVLAAPDPGIDLVAVAVLAELVDDRTEPAAADQAAEKPAQAARQHAAETAAGARLAALTDPAAPGVERA